MEFSFDDEGRAAGLQIPHRKVPVKPSKRNIIPR